MIVTDKLKSYGAARNEVMPSVEHVPQKYQNNRAENSHQPTRLREKAMRGFKSSGHAQRFLSVFGIITSHFRVLRHLLRTNTRLTPDPSAQIEHQPEDGQRSQSWFTLDFTPLRDSREFRLLYLGQSITFFGSMMTFVALPWQVFQLTKSSFTVGMIGVVEFIAVLFMGFVGGAIADYLSLSFAE